MLWLVACSHPDADARLRAHDVEGAFNAWESQTGQHLDARHPAADVLSRRAGSDPSITMASVAPTMVAVSLLDGAPDHHLQPVDIPLERLTPLVVCTRGMLQSPWLVAAGRSVVPADAEPIDGGALPWRRGRFIGAADDDAELEALFAALDKDPPPRLTTLALRSGGADLFLFLSRRDGGWLVMSATDAEAAARYVLACQTTRPAAQ